jgi:voltage-dependent potassium channel beta subunit
MLYRNLGPTGLKVSALSLGAWVTFGNQIGDPIAEKLLHTAYDAGVNFFDNAEGYAKGQAEVVMGDILKRSGWKRSSYIISSKVFFGSEAGLPNQIGLSRKHVVEACNAALKRFQVDHLDLYFCHRPDPETPISETARAMHDLIVQGKILYWGTSEWTGQQIKTALDFCTQHNLHCPIVEQPQYNIFHREKFEKDLAPIFKSPGLGSTVWSPLGSGLLTGKYNNGIPQDSRLNVPGLEWLKDRLTGEGSGPRLKAVAELAQVAKEIDVSLPRMAIAWCLKNPNVSTVVLGASKVEQLSENLTALDIVDRLSPQVMSKIETIAKAVVN